MIVLDSSFLIAAKNTRDVFHKIAAPLMLEVADGRWGKAIVLEYVFLETLGVLKRKQGVRAAWEAGGFLRRSREFDLVHGSDLFLATWNEFQADLHTPLSFVDHAVALVARQRAGGKILTFDKAFRGLPGLHVLPA